MTYCRNCGGELPEKAKFCPSCGVVTGTFVKEEFSVSSEDLVKTIREIFHDADVTKVIVRDERGKTLLEIPAWAGLVGALLAPWLAALGAIAALASNCTIVVERREDKPQRPSKKEKK